MLLGMFYLYVLWLVVFVLGSSPVENGRQQLQEKSKSSLLLLELNVLSKRGTSSSCGSIRPQFFTIITDKNRHSTSVFSQGFAESWQHEQNWAKCSKQWSWRLQMPPLVHRTKVKFNLLSAPPQPVTQDCLCSPHHPSPAGTKGRLPEGTRIPTIWSYATATLDEMTAIFKENNNPNATKGNLLPGPSEDFPYLSQYPISKTCHLLKRPSCNSSPQTPRLFNNRNVPLVHVESLWQTVVAPPHETTLHEARRTCIHGNGAGICKIRR